MIQTKITYWALRETSGEIFMPKYDWYWTEIVKGGPEELAARKEEIRREHRENCKKYRFTFVDQEAHFYDEFDVKYYLDYQI